MLTFSLHTSVSSFCFCHFGKGGKCAKNQTWALPKYCHITSWAEITANSQDCFSPGTHPPIAACLFFVLYCIVVFFFVCRQIRRKLPLFETCFCLGDNLRGFRVQILNSQINRWEMRSRYCGASLSVFFLVALTDTDIQWATGVQRENVKWIIFLKEDVSALFSGFFFCFLFFYTICLA